MRTLTHDDICQVNGAGENHILIGLGLGLTDLAFGAEAMFLGTCGYKLAIQLGVYPLVGAVVGAAAGYSIIPATVAVLAPFFKEEPL